MMLRLLWIVLAVSASLLALRAVTWQQDPTVFFPTPTTATEQRALAVVSERLNAKQESEPVMLAVTFPNANTDADINALSEQIKHRLQQADPKVAIRNQAESQVFGTNEALFNARYLLVDWSSSLTPWQDFWQQWQWQFGEAKTALLRDPSQAWSRYLTQATAYLSKMPTQDVWHLRESDGVTLLFLLTPPSAQALPSLIALLEQQRQAYPHADWRWSSAQTIAWQTRTQIEASMLFITLASLGLLLAFLSWRLRRIAAVAWVFIPLALSALFSTLMVQWLFGHVHPLTLALGMVLLGVSIDYPLHLLLNKTSNQAWFGVRIAILTTLAGYLSLFIFSAEGFRQLAVFAVSGFVFLFALFIGLRALKWQPCLRDYSLRLARPASRWLGLLPLLALLALVLKPIHWQDDLAALSPVPAELLAQDGQLRSWFQQPQVDQLLLVSGATTQAVLQRLEQLQPSFMALQTQGVLRASLSVVDWLPSAQRQAQRQQDLPTEEAIMHALETLNLPFRATHFTDLFADLEQARTADILTPAQFEQQALEWQQAVLPFLLSEREGETVARIVLFNVQDANALADWAQAEGLELLVQRRFIQAQVAELRVTLLSVLSGMIALFILALALIYRRPVVWGRMAFSLLLTALTTLGLLHAFLPALSVFHLVALLLVMAISVDYAVFIEQAKRTSASLLSVNTALITSLLTFGLLLFTPIPLLVAMGQTLIVGVLSAYWMTRWVHRH